MAPASTRVHNSSITEENNDTTNNYNNHNPISSNTRADPTQSKNQRRSTLLVPTNAHEAGPRFLPDDRVLVDISRRDYDQFLRFVLERRGCPGVLNHPLSSEARRPEPVREYDFRPRTSHSAALEK